MVGRICWENLGRFRVVGEKTRESGLSLFQVSLSPKGKLYPYRLSIGLSLCQEEKVRHLLLPVDFDRFDLLAKKGLRQYNPLPALQELGGRLTLVELARLGILPQDATVVLVGDRVSPAFGAVALALCPFVRGLSIQAPQGGQRLQSQLYRHYGIAPSPWDSHCSLVVSFVPWEEPISTPILSLDSVKSPAFSRIRLKNGSVPQDISPLAWIGLLLETGRISQTALDYA